MRGSLLIIVMLLTFLSISAAQNPEPISHDNTILVIGEGDVTLPADKANLTVVISGSDESDATKAYERHRAMEAKLLKAIEDFHIPANNLHYSLITLRRSSDYNSKDSHLQTYQSVRITLDSITQVLPIQTRLFEAKFQNLEASFFASNAGDGLKEAMKHAIQRAKEKAELYATEAGLKLGKILKVMDTEETEPRLANYHGDEVIKFQSGYVQGLMDIPQTVPVHAQVKVLFAVGD